MSLKECLSKAGALLSALLFILPFASAASKYTVLHAFGGDNDGSELNGGVILDQKGRLYGTTLGGGNGYGTVFKLSRRPSGHWVEKLLHSFDFSDGANPMAGLVFGAGGSLYGTTSHGGIHGVGTVFDLVPGPPGWNVMVLYSFGDDPNDAALPSSSVVMDPSGSLFGTAAVGGGGETYGSVYQLTATPGGWTESILHRFCSQPNCTDGRFPLAGVILGGTDKLYGVTVEGGDYGYGAVFKLRRMQDGSWKEDVLHSFGSAGDGALPGSGNLAYDGSGNLYGTTTQGGRYRCVNTGCGVVFKLSRQPSGHWKETIIHAFKPGKGGYSPSAGVVIDQAGNLYGATVYGGTDCQCGVVYKLTPNPDGSWTYAVLHRFTGSDGLEPAANLILDDQGNLYGTTMFGGPYDGGVVFKITP